MLVRTAPSTVGQRVRGLRLGADDWIGKPCHPEEAMARIEAVARRHRAAKPHFEVGPLVVGELEIRPDRFQAYVGGDSVDLTRREFELLEMFAESTGRVHERGAIYQCVWGCAIAHGDRSVDVFVRKLRHKLEKRSPGWTCIHTHFEVGCPFDPEPVTGGGEPLAPRRLQARHELDTSAEIGQSVNGFKVVRGPCRHVRAGDRRGGMWRQRRRGGRQLISAPLDGVRGRLALRG